MLVSSVDHVGHVEHVADNDVGCSLMIALSQIVGSRCRPADQRGRTKR